MSVFDRLPTGERQWQALIDHVLAVGNDSVERHFLELKKQLPFNDVKKAGAIVTKYLAASLNRDPAVAGRYLGGRALMLVGISGTEVHTVEAFEAEALAARINEYCSNIENRWDHHLIRHPAGIILAFVADPPDPARICIWQKEAEGAKLSDGAVPIRRDGASHKANGREMQGLLERFLWAHRATVDLNVDISGSPVFLEHGDLRTLWEDLIDGEVAKILPPEPSETVPELPVKFRQMSLMKDAESMRREMEQWAATCRKRLTNFWYDTVLLTAPRVSFSIVNNSRKFLEGVEVTLRFPESYRAFEAKNSQATGLPPVPNERIEFAPTLAGAAMLHNLLPQPLGHDFMTDFELSDSGRQIKFHVGKLRPKDAVRLDGEFVILLTPDIDSTINSGLWSVTAEGVDDIFEGEFEISLAAKLDVEAAISARFIGAMAAARQ